MLATISWVKVILGLSLAAVIAAGFYFLDADRDHWENLAGERRDKIVELQTKLDNLSRAQNDQTKIIDKVITRVVEGPERIKTVVKTIHDAPEPANCGTPELPKEVKDLL